MLNLLGTSRRWGGNEPSSVATNIPALIRAAARKAEFSQMICEAQRQMHVRSLPKGVEGFVLVAGVDVAIERTACNLGGSRAWFLCPACNRRCAILYPVRCRLCLSLNYASEHEGELDRLLRKAVKHRHKHGQQQRGIGVPFPIKPKWMRWHTYIKARKKAELIGMQIIEGFRFQTIAQSA